MGGFRIPGTQSDPDWSIQDGTLSRTKSPAPALVCTPQFNNPFNKADTPLPPTEQVRLAICVFFFGGYKSSAPDMDLWINSAQKQRGDVQFHAFPYPADASPEPPANVLNKFGAALDAIKNAKAEKIYVVGHSSGCAIANAVALRFQDNDKMILVALDGFLPNAKLLSRTPSTQVWGAVGGKKGKSLHHDGMQSGGKDKFHEFKANDDCTTKFSLHFSLVNVAISDEALKNDKHVEDLKNGYKQCETNLCWL